MLMAKLRQYPRNLQLSASNFNLYFVNQPVSNYKFKHYLLDFILLCRFSLKFTGSKFLSLY